MVEHLGLAGEAVRVGWGYRPSGLAALKAAGSGGERLLLLEDALVRSMRPGDGPVYGLVADSKGIYFDAAGRSDLIETLESGTRRGWLAEAVADRSEVEHLLARFRESGASKYNWFPGDYRCEPLPAETGVMVIDQTRGDASLAHGGVGAGDFDRMVRDALDENPGQTVYVRAHPDHRYRGKHSCLQPWVFDGTAGQTPAARTLAGGMFPVLRDALCGDFVDGHGGPGAWLQGEIVWLEFLRRLGLDGGPLHGPGDAQDAQIGTLAPV